MSVAAPRPAPARRPSWEETLAERGRRLVRGGNQPFSLTADAAAWKVEGGRVEIFAVAADGEGRESGRWYVAAAGEGEWVFGTAAAAPALELLAVPHAGTRLLRIERDAVTPTAWNDGLEPACAAWLDRLCRGAERPRAAAVPRELAPGAALELADGEAARAAAAAVWVTAEGTCRLWGEEGLELPPDAVVPLPPAAWVLAAGEAVLTAAAGAPLPGPGLAGHDRLVALLLAHLAAALAGAGQAERERLERRHAVDRATVERASRVLASVLDREGTAAVPVEATDAPLLTAARWVAAAQGIELRSPPVSGEAAPRPGDLLHRVCGVSRVRFRRVLLRDDWWRRDNGPLVAFLAEGGEDEGAARTRHPVALLPRSPTRYELADPRGGAPVPVDAALADRLTGDAYMFYPPLPARRLRFLDLVRAMAREARQDASTVVAMGALGGLLALALPLVTGAVFGYVIPGADRSQLVQMTLAWILAAFAIAALRLVRALALLRVGGRIDGALQPAVWDRLLALPVDFFRRYSVGDLADRASGVSQIRELLAGSAAMSLLASAFSVFSFALLFYFSLHLALVAAGMVVLLIGIAALLGWLQVREQRNLYRVRGRIASLLFALIHGIAKLRVGGAEGRAYALWAERFTEQRRHTIRARRIAIAQSTFLAVFQVLSLLAIFAMVGLSLREELPVGQFLAFNAAFGQVLGAALVVVNLLPELLSAVPVYERLAPILHTPPEVDETKAEAGELQGDVELSHVTFRYGEDQPDVLHEVSLRAQPGEFVALVGPSGSGKSTCLRLLLGFERPQSGSIYFDGQDLSGLSLLSVRRQLGVVLQNGRLMAGTIFSNIVGNADLGMDEAWEAARLVGLADDVRAMPMGMHTVVAEGAGTFSGGQKQRLLIARAIVHRPRMLLFDEATSALDNRVQEVVSRSLERLEATRIVVAHRLSTVRHADRIYVLEAGRVVESGSYQELLARGGPFARLAARQTV